MDNNEKTVTISEKEYKSLKEDALVLRHLEGAGVDNWEGYDFAMESLREDPDYEES